jgi:hypothetical protein
LVKATLNCKTPFRRARLGSGPVENFTAKAAQMMDAAARFFAENRPFRRSRNHN